jgi:murein L,D-transpeptidase YafK
MDRLAGRGGNAIWLHGTNKELMPRDSNGCIVVENDTIDRLAGYIRLHRTPIIIVDKITPEAFDRVQAQKAVLKILDRWQNALTEGTYHDYLSVYDPAYLPDLSWWQDWRKLRSKLSQDQLSFSVEIARPAIFHHRNLYTVLFDQVLRTPYEEVRFGTRKLYLARGKAGFRIVGDEDQVLPERLGGKAQGQALVAAARTLKTTGIEHEIAAMVDGWLKAWSAKDIDQYASYYSRDFRSQGGADRDAWIRYKHQLNKKYRFIRVTRKNKLTIEQGKGQSTVSFVQSYASNAFKTLGIKKLVLKREGNQWKIVREMFNQI